MTARKTADKPASRSAKSKAKPSKSTDSVADLKTVTEAGGPEHEGEAYRVGYIGVSSDDVDYSLSAQAAKLAES